MTTAKTNTILQKITEASKEMDNPRKRAENPHFKSKFANLADTMDVIEPVLEKYGLWHRAGFDGSVFVYIVYDVETEESAKSYIDLAALIDGLDGNVWQQIGQAFTYLRRYLAQAFWGLVPEDDDAQSAPSRPAAQRKPQPTQVAAERTMERVEGNGGGAL